MNSALAVNCPDLSASLCFWNVGSDMIKLLELRFDTAAAVLSFLPFLSIDACAPVSCFEPRLASACEWRVDIRRDLDDPCMFLPYMKPKPLVLLQLLPSKRYLCVPKGRPKC